MVIVILLGIIAILILMTLCVVVDGIKHLASIKRDVSECERILYRQERRQEYKK